MHLRMLPTLLGLAIYMSPAACAEIFVDIADSESSPITSTELFSFDVSEAHQRLGIGSTATLQRGSGTVRVLDPAGVEIYKHLWGTTRSQERAPLPVIDVGKHTLEISTDAAAGTWRVRIHELPAKESLRAMYVLAYSLAALAAGLIITAKRAGAPMLTLATGAVMYLLGSLVSLVGGVVLQLTLFARLEFAVSHATSIWIQSLFLGFCSGTGGAIAVCGIAYVFKSARSHLGAALGAGIGVASCLLLANGFIAYQGLAAMFSDGPKSEMAQFRQAYEMAVTPLLPLAELLILAAEALCRIAATVLFIYALRARKLLPIAWGVLLIGGAMAAVSVARAIALLGPESRWVPALLCLPFAAAAVIALRRNAPQWDELQRGNESPLDSFLRQHEEAQ